MVGIPNAIMPALFHFAGAGLAEVEFIEQIICTWADLHGFSAGQIENK